MKTEQEIKAEIQATTDTLEKYQEAVNKKEIASDEATEKILEFHAIIGALRWTLSK